MKRTLVTIIATTVLYCISCKDAVSPEQGLDYTAETPRHCILSLEYALNNRETALYEAMLSPDFVFYFDDDDVGTEINGFTVPTSWGHEEECRAITNMLRPYEEGGAYELEAYAFTDYMGDPPDNFEVYFTVDADLRIYLLVNEMWELISADNTHYFEFAKINSNAESFWVITEWAVFQDTENYYESIGTIKAYYYSLNPLQK